MTDETSKAAKIAGVHPGDVVGERYRIETILGAGAMGVVVAARHIELDDPVAIKFLSQDLLDNSNALGRFQREARAAARIKHEHVIRVYDVGKLPSGVPYLVMERLDGSDLATLLHDEGPLPLGESLRCVREACAGIAEAHRLGIVHRDIKPSNLFCVRRPNARPSVKVLDFGISKLTEPAPGGSMTGTSHMLGSPSYMSPEQMRAPNRVDHRTDIWSLGVVLYELATGTLPFGGSSYPELCLSVTSDNPEPPRARCPDLPVELEAIVLKCLRKNRDDRYANVDELAQALDRFAAGQHEASFKPVSTSRNTQAPNAVSPPTLTAPAEWSPSPAPLSAAAGRSTWARTVRPLVTLPRRYQLALGGLGAAFVLSVGLVWWSAARSGPVASPTFSHDSSVPPEHVSVPIAAPPRPAPPLSSASSAPALRPAAGVAATSQNARAAASVSIRALGTAEPAPRASSPARASASPAASARAANTPAANTRAANTPAASAPARPPPRPQPARSGNIPVQRSASSVWTSRE